MTAFTILIVALIASVYESECSESIGIIHMHGLKGNPFKNLNFKRRVESKTGIPVHLLDVYNGIESFTAMKTQIEKILPIVQNIAAQYDKIIAVGYSQGGLLWRAMIEEWDQHNVEVFITLASPQHGVYGVPPLAEKYIPFFDWFSTASLYKVIYTSYGQKIAPFNYYLDPTHYSIYLKQSAFFPELNNELAQTPSSEKLRRKNNFLRLSKMVLVGGKDEDAIDPWQSTLFGFYTEDGLDGMVVNMEKTRLYEKDLFGLKTLDKRGGVSRCRYDGIRHTQFRDHENMLERCVFPVLKPYSRLVDQ